MRAGVHRALLGFALLAMIAACASFGDANVATPVAPADAGDGGGSDDAAVLDDAAVADAPSPKDGGSVDVDRVVFVTNQQYTGGQIGGLAGATAICNALAKLSKHPAVNGKVFVPWLSDAKVSPASTFVKSNGRYVTPSGMLIAASWTELTNGTPHAAPIAEDEQGLALPLNTDIWTGTRIDGAPEGTNHCAGWTSASTTLDGANGRAQAVDKSWTAATTDGCENNHRFYCFEK